ncbi:MAG: hypothetical protein ACFFEV_08055 [Candidatus Thorarchaeota archaeon]
MRTSHWFGIFTVVAVVIVMLLAYHAFNIDRLDDLVAFVGVLLGFMLAYFASEGLRHYNEEKEADEILADVQVELELLLIYLSESDDSAYTSATGSLIKSQGLTFKIDRDKRKKVLDVFTCLESYNSIPGRLHRLKCFLKNW